jgi:hypothetical protein
MTQERESPLLGPNRQFECSGEQWTAYRVLPATADAATELDKGGWIAFRGPRGDRWLQPIPEDWFDCTPARMCVYLDRSRPADEHRAPRASDSRSDRADDRTA